MQMQEPSHDLLILFYMCRPAVPWNGLLMHVHMRQSSSPLHPRQASMHAFSPGCQHGKKNIQLWYAAS